MSPYSGFRGRSDNDHTVPILQAEQLCFFKSNYLIMVPLKHLGYPSENYTKLRNKIILSRVFDSICRKFSLQAESEENYFCINVDLTNSKWLMAPLQSIITDPTISSQDKSLLSYKGLLSQSSLSGNKFLSSLFVNLV